MLQNENIFIIVSKIISLKNIILGQLMRCPTAQLIFDQFFKININNNL